MRNERCTVVRAVVGITCMFVSMVARIMRYILTGGYGDKQTGSVSESELYRVGFTHNGIEMLKSIRDKIARGDKDIWP